MSSLFIDSQAENLNTPSKIDFPAPVPSSTNEPSKQILTEYSSEWPWILNPQNVLPPLRSPDISPCQHTTSQSPNDPNYNFNLGLMYANDPTSSQYDPPPKVFQYIQQILTMEWNQPYHCIVYQILSRRIWQILNQEVHLRHFPYLLSQYFRLSCSYMMI